MIFFVNQKNQAPKATPTSKKQQQLQPIKQQALKTTPTSDGNGQTTTTPTSQSKKMILR